MKGDIEAAIIGRVRTDVGASPLDRSALLLRRLEYAFYIGSSQKRVDLKNPQDFENF